MTQSLLLGGGGGGMTPGTKGCGPGGNWAAGTIMPPGPGTHIPGGGGGGGGPIMPGGGWKPGPGAEGKKKIIIRQCGCRRYTVATYVAPHHLVATSTHLIMKRSGL